MKTILTLLLVVGSLASAQAQTSREEARRVILGGGNGSQNKRDRDVVLGGENERNRFPGSYPSGDRQAQIDQINREYDNKIQSIRNNPYLSADEKDRSIRQLERDRQRRISDLNRRYSDRDNNRDRDRDRDHDHDDDDDRYENRGDNGKHKGWYKKDKNKNWKKGNRKG